MTIHLRGVFHFSSNENIQVRLKMHYVRQLFQLSFYFHAEYLIAYCEILMTSFNLIIAFHLNHMHSSSENSKKCFVNSYELWRLLNAGNEIVKSLEEYDFCHMKYEQLTLQKRPEWVNYKYT